jgi:hypothetical protein
MKKIVFLPFLFLIVINCFAQMPGDTLCPFETVSISKQTKFIDASLDYDVINVPQQTFNAYRNIFFIHGLGGDATAWLKVADACQNSALTISGFPARKCFTHRLDYTHATKQPISAAAQSIGQDIKNISNSNTDVNPNTAILIAHSQGGVVCRELMHKDFVEKQDYASGKYGGIVTVASPLQGARILNNRYQIHNMLNEGCRALTTDILTVSIIGPIMVSLISPTLTAHGIPTPTPGIICDIVTEPVMKSIASSYYDQITDAYVVDESGSKISVYNSDVNNAGYCNLPKVVFYAVEPRENILWRTAQWMTDNPNDEVHFGANNDMRFYDKAIYPFYIAYSAASVVNDVVYSIAEKTLKWTWWCCPISATTAATTMTVSASVRPLISKGRNWFEGANLQWQVLIGAITYDSQTGWGVKENDGVVLSESAMNLPCASRLPIRIFPNENNPNVTDKGSSHMQVRNDEGIKEHLNNLFNGDYGDFFATRKK